MTRIIQTLSLIIVTTYSIFSFFQLDLKNIDIYMIDSLLISNILLSVYIILYSLSKGIKKHFALFGFVVSFSIFNFGTYLFNMGNDAYSVHVFHAVNYISYYNVARSLLLTYVALITFFGVYIIVNRFNKKYKIVFKKSKYKINDSVYENSAICKIKSLSKKLMIFGSIFAFIKLGNEIIFVLKNGYNAYYLSSSYNIPFIDMFDGFYLIGFWGFLSTMPSKKEFKKPVFIFLIYSFSTLLMGKRGIFITNILTLIWFLMKWDLLDKYRKVIFTKTRMLTLLIVSFFILAMMYQVNEIRSGYAISYDGNSVLEKALDTVESLGGTGKTLALALEYENALEIFDSENVLFNPIIRYIKNNAVIRIMGGGYTTIQNVEILNEVGTFSGMLTYLSNPIAFKNGGGVGSNYLAELYISYGWLSLILYNIMVGYFLYKIDNINLIRWENRFLFIFIFNAFMFLPRSQAFEFVPQLVLPILVSSIILFSSKNFNISKGNQITINDEYCECELKNE